MIDARKVLPDITLEDVGIGPSELLKSVDGRMSALPSPRGVGIEDERRIEDRFQDIVNRMMDHAIPIRSGADHPLFRFVNSEMAVNPRSIGARRKLLMKPPQLVLEKKVKSGGRVFEPFAAPRELGRVEEVLKRNDPAIEIFVPPHVLACFNQPPNWPPVS